MGFYLRKSISVGPLRFNLSKSGIGVSAGVKKQTLGSDSINLVKSAPEKMTHTYSYIRQCRTRDGARGWS
jgi:hypothetical protein